jgi:type I restriction enzyme, S subunit
MSDNDWQETTIGDIVEFFDNVRVPLSSQQRQERQGEYPYYGASGIIDYIDDYIFNGRYLLIAEDGENLNSRKLSIAFFGKGKFWVNNHAHIVRALYGIADDYYIFSWFANANISGYITGAAQPKLSQANLRRIPLKLPPLHIQRKIAAILSTYDDLIENNARRIKILEEMAQAIYREWFVHFRFPGHEGVRMVESEIGLVPEGWEVQTVEETFEISGGGTPSTKVPEYWESGTINWYSPVDLTASETMFMDCSGNQINELGLKKSSAKIFQPYSVMMTSRATLGVISINTTEACTNQGFITCIPNERFPLYILYHWLKENVEMFISLGTGSTFKEITKGVFKTIQLIVPPSEVASHFETTVQPHANQILNLQRKNANLRRTRDLLLPKLISGELDVSELDIMIPEAEA